jgi:hypothetical protein
MHKPPLEEHDAHPHSRTRKSTKRWCKGVVGREHQPELRLDPRVASWGGTCKPLSWQPPRRDQPAWYCVHHVICTECGKITDHFPLCPDMPDGYRKW